MAELTASIAERGVLQPILIRPIESGYQIVAGERRWRAAQTAGLHEIPALVRDMDDAMAVELAIVENVQRADLNAIEEGEAYQRLIDEFGHTQEAVGKVVGKSRSHVANLLRLLELPEPVRAAVIEGAVTMGHARAMLGSQDPVATLHAVRSGGLSVRETETRVAAEAAVKSSRRALAAERDPDLAALEARVRDALGLAITITSVDGRGQVSVNYASLDQLDLICKRLSAGRV